MTVAGLNGTEAVHCSRSVVIVPDCDLASVAGGSLFDAVILPGGLRGAEALSESPAVGQILKQHEERGKIVAAICAGIVDYDCLCRAALQTSWCH